MPAKSTVVVASIGVLATSAAFVIGLITGANNASVSIPRATPAPYCFADPDPNPFTKKHVQTKIVACQVLGMTKPEAMAYIESKGLTHRIAYEDGESFALTEDYTDSRINLEIMVGLVVGATAW